MGRIHRCCVILCLIFSRVCASILKSILLHQCSNSASAPHNTMFSVEYRFAVEWRRSTFVLVTDCLRPCASDWMLSLDSCRPSGTAPWTPSLLPRLSLAVTSRLGPSSQTFDWLLVLPAASLHTHTPTPHWNALPPDVVLAESIYTF